MSFIKSPASLRVVRYKSLFTSTPNVTPNKSNLSNKVQSDDTLTKYTSLFTRTPNVTPNKSNLSNKVQSDDTLTNSFHHLPLATVKLNTSQEISNNSNLQNGNTSEQCIVRKATSKLDTLQLNLYSRTRKPHTTMVKPFSFDLREKMKQKYKQEQQRTNKDFKQETKATEFRANPIPKFIKLRFASGSINTESNTEVKVPQKHVTRNTEKPGMKPQSVTSISTAILAGSKMQPLRFVTRAQERKQFDKGLKEKEKLREERKKKELEIQKQHEREEILRLRKQLVHKAQPIPAYTGLPKIEKRPLTEPITPLVIKRRRRR